MTHQLAPAASARTPAGRRAAPRAKIFQHQPDLKPPPPLAPPATPRAGLALLGNDNSAIVGVSSSKGGAASVKAAEAAAAAERGPPPASDYEAPFEWEFLSDTADWLQLLRRFGCGGVGGGLSRGARAQADAEELLNNKENVPPRPDSPASLSPTSPTTRGSRHWEETPTRPRRRDEDRMEVCFDIHRIL